MSKLSNPEPEISKDKLANDKAAALSENFFKNPRQNCTKIGIACGNACAKLGCKCCVSTKNTSARVSEFEHETNHAINQVYAAIREQEAKNKIKNSIQKKLKAGAVIKEEQEVFDLESIPYLNLEANKTDQEESTYSFELDSDFNFKKQADKNLYPNYTISSRKNFLAVWTDKFISLHRLYLEKAINYPAPSLKAGGTKLSNQILNDSRAVFFTPREDRLVVVCTDCIRIFDIELTKSSQKPVTVIPIAEVIKINHLSFLDSEDNFGGSTSNFVNLNPNYLFMNMSRAYYEEDNTESGCYATYTCLINISEEILETTGEAELTEIEHDAENFPDVGLRDNNQLYFYSSLQQGWFHIYIEGSTTKISFLEEHLTSANEIRKTKINKQASHHKKPINQTLFANSTATEKGMILVSEPTQYIYILSFNVEEGMLLKEIITLPARIRKINQVTQDDELKFILFNADDGDMYIFARTREEKYGLIYFNSIGTAQSLISLSPDLSYINIFSQTTVKVINFAPFDLQIKEVGPSAVKVSDIVMKSASADTKVFNLLLDDYHCLKIT